MASGRGKCSPSAKGSHFAAVWKQTWSPQLLVAVLVLPLFFIAYMSWPSIERPAAAEMRGTVMRGQLAELNPFFEVMHGADVVWQIPSNPKAVVFLAHGCTHFALHFWDTHPKCSLCYGLPEDRTIVRRAVARGYAVVAVSSANVCWDSTWPPEKSHDVQVVTNILRDWRRQHGLEQLPMAALGASSGGYFISVLAHKVEFSALAIMISGGVASAFSQPMAGGKKYPPTLFVHMPRDEHTALSVGMALRTLRKGGTESAMLACSPLPITPHFFAERINGLDTETSEKVHAALSEAGLVDDRGFLVEDPRGSPWRELLLSKNILPEAPGGTPKAAGGGHQWEEDISEELNLAFASHELTSIPTDEILDWFEGKCFLEETHKEKRCDSFPSA